MLTIDDYHAHVYFAADTVVRATSLCERLRDDFGLTMGRVHQKLVGPHPRWSCQMTVPVERIGSVIGWLALNREGLTVFIHPNTGDALADHTEHAIWMGEMLDLNVGMFRPARSEAAATSS